MQGVATVTSKDENLVLSSEDSSSPDDDAGLELGLGLSLSQPIPKNHRHHHHHHHHHHHAPYARILTAKDFPSSPSSSSSSTPPPSLSRVNNSTAGTKRTADSVNNAPSQVVGWPPVRSYRINSFNSQLKPPSSEVFNSMSEKSKGNNNLPRKSADNGNDNNNADIKEKRSLGTSRFVKVNMDGIGIGRKVDLSAHSSYEALAQTLEDMFKESNAVITCKGSNGEDSGIIVRGERDFKLLDGSSKFVLTYEDKDGDWMLVGDVPWGMFLTSVRKLRIMRTSEANGNGHGLAPRLEEKNCRQKSKPI